METATIRDLCKGYLAGSLTKQELQQFLAYLKDNHEHSILKEEMLTLLQEEEDVPATDGEKADSLLRQLLTTIRRDADMQEAKPPRRMRWLRIAAAILLILLGTWSFYWFRYSSGPETTALPGPLVNDVAPGGNKAVLTLSNGAQIILDSTDDGTLASQGNAKVVKINNGQIAYKISAGLSGREEKKVSYNTLSTPKGGQYQVRLPDGTMVWLNAASSIRYPVVFTGKEREVQITGEAYFEVAKNRTMPFVVKKGNAEVQVLGTHFNINAYDDEAALKVTLLEGMVKVTQLSTHASQLVRPGEQARVNDDGRIKLDSDIDVNEVTAWKNGLFQFDGNDIQEVMRQVVRWYDVEVEYSGTVSQRFYGNISRNVNVSEIFKMLEMTEGVKFMIQGKKIIVMPYK